MYIISDKMILKTDIDRVELLQLQVDLGAGVPWLVLEMARSVLAVVLRGRPVDFFLS